MAMPHLWHLPDHTVQLKARSREDREKSPPPRRRRSVTARELDLILTRMNRDFSEELEPKPKKRKASAKKKAAPKKVKVVKKLTRYDRLMADDD